ncbi:unnamed protein product [Prunus armeniaca]
MVPTHIKHSFDTISSLKLGDVIFLTWIKKGYISIHSSPGKQHWEVVKGIFMYLRVGLLAYDDGDVGCLRCGLVMCEVLEALAEFLGRYQVRGAHVQKPIGHTTRKERDVCKAVLERLIAHHRTADHLKPYQRLSCFISYSKFASYSDFSSYPCNRKSYKL